MVGVLLGVTVTTKTLLQGRGVWLGSHLQDTFIWGLGQFVGVTDLGNTSGGGEGVVDFHLLKHSPLTPQAQPPASPPGQ